MCELSKLDSVKHHLRVLPKSIRNITTPLFSENPTIRLFIYVNILEVFTAWNVFTNLLFKHFRKLFSYENTWKPV